MDKSLIKKLFSDLQREIQKAVNSPKCDAHWKNNFFLPALAILKEKKYDAGSLRSVCNSLNVFGGMGSYNDGYGPNSEGIFKVKKSAEGYLDKQDFFK